LQKILEEKGLLSLATANTVIRLVPPMTVSEQEIDEAISRIHDGCAVFQEMSEETRV
jgi:acetylornithine/succinyldiaminopimelate/putrescine aminotransferase